MMHINWFEIVAGIINFFVLLFILQKLLYKPVIKAMAERQDKIQRFQIEADEKMTEAKELISQYHSKITEIDGEKREILSNARKEAQEKKNSLLNEYKSEAQIKRKAYLKEIQDEKENFLINLSKNLGTNAVEIASHILRTISSKEVEDEVFKVFIANLNKLDENIIDSKAIKKQTLKLVSARELRPEEKKAIKSLLEEQIGNFERIDYKKDESLILGHKLELDTYTVHTNIKSYLDKIERDIIKILDTN